MPDDCWLTVKYSDRKPEYCYSKNIRKFREKMFAVAGTKATQWSYEKEIRLVIADTALRQGRFLQLTPKSVAGVYYGCRTAEKDKLAVEGLLAISNMKHVEVCEAILDESGYMLKFDQRF